MTAIERLDGAFRVDAGEHSLSTRFLVNAAGLRSDEIDRLLGDGGFTIIRGAGS